MCYSEAVHIIRVYCQLTGVEEAWNENHVNIDPVLLLASVLDVLFHWTITIDVR